MPNFKDDPEISALQQANRDDAQEKVLAAQHRQSLAELELDRVKAEDATKRAVLLSKNAFLRLWVKLNPDEGLRLLIVFIAGNAVGWITVLWVFSLLD